MFYAWHSDINRLSQCVGAMIDALEENKTSYREVLYFMAMLDLDLFIRDMFPDMKPYICPRRGIFGICDKEGRIVAIAQVGDGL